MTVRPITHDAQLFINGEFTDSASGKTMDIVNPATGKVVGRLADSSVPDVDRAVKAAQDAFDLGTWSKASIHERARVLNRFADLFEADLEAFFKLETLNNGRPDRGDSRADFTPPAVLPLFRSARAYPAQRRHSRRRLLPVLHAARSTGRRGFDDVV